MQQSHPSLPASNENNPLFAKRFLLKEHPDSLLRFNVFDDDNKTGDANKTVAIVSISSLSLDQQGHDREG